MYTHRNPYSTPGTNTSMICLGHAHIHGMHAYMHAHTYTHTCMHIQTHTHHLASTEDQYADLKRCVLRAVLNAGEDF